MHGTLHDYNGARCCNEADPHTLPPPPLLRSRRRTLRDCQTLLNGRARECEVMRTLISSLAYKLTCLSLTHCEPTPGLGGVMDMGVRVLSGPASSAAGASDGRRTGGWELHRGDGARSVVAAAASSQQLARLDGEVRSS
jgi:hypothetical protein